MKNHATGTYFKNWEEILASDYYVVSIIVLFAAAIILILPIYYFIKNYFRYYPSGLKPIYMQYVGQMSYYQSLSPINQKRFAKRCQLFINTKTFIPRGNGFELKAEMIAKIAASAVEISFGFPKMGFEHFSKILVYPNDYYSSITRQYHKGEVNLRGMIVLSWRSFEEGYANAEDGINLAIHEMAHALKLENRIANGDYQFLDARLMLELKAEFERFKANQSLSVDSLLRSYAATNIHEFFAVLCENFFERPKVMQQDNPALYRIISKLLMQDPLERDISIIQPASTFSRTDFNGPIKRN